MFIPEIKWKKEDNDKAECRKIARTLATEMANTYGGEVDKLTDIVDDILDTAFLLGKSCEMVSDYCKSSAMPLATQAYLVIMGKICNADIPKDAMPNLANAVFYSMPFWNIMPRVKDYVREVFRNEDLKKERGNGEF